MNGIKIGYFLSGLYDFLLGMAFLFVPVQVFNLTHIMPPNHWGYVSFAAAMLTIFGIMFFQIAKDPIANKNLIPYGVLLKISYCGVVFGYHFNGGIPNIWVYFGVFDFIFLLFFVYSYIKLRNQNV
ncbi:MAG: hypothetical protein PHC64_06635 [Candidatus Gastranaerophilales bacterium]|nr:hypothetical protein [Candidatus Gastranaerophilales bacterium]